MSHNNGTITFFWGYVLLRIGLTVVVVTFVVYWLMRIIPGNAAIIQQGFSATHNSSNTSLNAIVLDYVRWLGNIIIFDFGTSLFVNQSVARYVLPYFFRTSLLALCSLLVSLLFAQSVLYILLNAKSKVVRTTLVGIVRLILSIPEFWLSIILIYVFIIQLSVLPLIPERQLIRYVLPLLVLAISRGAVFVEIQLDTIKENSKKLYIISAMLRKVSRWRLYFNYHTKNSLYVIISLATIQFGYLIGGAVIVERIFLLPGFGKILLLSIQQRDYPVAQFCVLLLTLMFSALGIFGDYIHHRLNPEILQGDDRGNA